MLDFSTITTKTHPSYFEITQKARRNDSKIIFFFLKNTPVFLINTFWYNLHKMNALFFISSLMENVKCNVYWEKIIDFNNSANFFKLWVLYFLTIFSVMEIFVYSNAQGKCLTANDTLVVIHSRNCILSILTHFFFKQLKEAFKHHRKLKIYDKSTRSSSL